MSARMQLIRESAILRLANRRAINRKTGAPRGAGEGGHRPWTQREINLVRSGAAPLALALRLGRTLKAVECMRNKLSGVVGQKQRPRRQSR